MNTEIELELRKEIYSQHRKKGHKVMLGMNFVECFTCGFHAHETYHGYLIHHNNDYTIYERIK